MCWQRVAVLLVSSVVLAACETPRPTQVYTDFSARQVADVHLGEPVTLFDFPPTTMTALLSEEGRAHAVVIDAAGGIHHAEVSDKGVVSRERIGEVQQADGPVVLDVAEYPTRTIRVLAGTSLFIRDATTRTWQEQRGSRCARFLRVGSRLYCGFVASGEEFGSPKRSDLYGVVVLLFPLLVPVQHQSKKLVVAELDDSAWIVRGVVDAEDKLDATQFMMASDNRGNIHVLYLAGRGGYIFWYGGGLAGGPEPTLRYLLIDGDALRRAAKGTRQGEPDSSLLFLSGKDVRRSADLRLAEKSFSAPIELADLGLSYVALNPVSGAFEAVVRGHAVKRGSQFKPPHKPPQLSGLLSFELSDGLWRSQASLVVPDEWPASTYVYFENALVKTDSRGGVHAVGIHKTTFSPWAWSSPDNAISYFVRRESSWSLPVTFQVALDDRYVRHDRPETKNLLAVDAGRAFVAWPEKGIGLRGRWILSRELVVQ